MKKAKKAKYIPVSEGDLVLVEFGHRSDQTRLVKVTEVKPRHGLVSGGKIPQAPLIIGTNTETGTVERFDNSYIIEVLERSGDKTLPKNIYRNIPDEKMLCALRGAWCGTLLTVAKVALGKLSIHGIQRPVDFEKLEALFWKQRPGLVDYESRLHFVCVHRKPFQRWIQQNSTRLLTTVADIRKYETERNRMFESDYWAEVDRMERNNLSEFEDPTSSHEMEIDIMDY